MEPGDALGIAAQIAVTLVGFTGVVVVFGNGAIHEWPAVDRLRLRTLVMFSVVPLALSLVAMLLSTTGLPLATIWRISSGLASLFLFTIGTLTLRLVVSIQAAELRAAGGSRHRSFVLTALGFAITGLQIWNLVAAAFWPFFVAIVSTILAALIQFVQFVLNRPAPASR